jgi:hypothetical protein
LTAVNRGTFAVPLPLPYRTTNTEPITHNLTTVGSSEHLYYFDPTSFAFPACTKLARNIRADNIKRLPLPTKNYEPISISTIDHLSTQTGQRAIPFHYHPETNPATGMFLSRLQKTSSSCPPQQQRNHQDKPSKPAGPKQAACKRQRTA